MNMIKFSLPSRFLMLFVVVALVATATQSVSAQTKPPTSEARFAKLDGARVHYVNYGKGDEALVLIHGWTQSIDAAGAIRFRNSRSTTG